MIYLIILAVILTIFGVMYIFLNKFQNKWLKYIAIFIFIFILIALCSLKGDKVGTDTPAYFKIYSNISSLNFWRAISSSSDIGFAFLCKICSLIVPDLYLGFRLMLVMMYILTFFPIGFALCRKECNLLFVCTLLYCFFLNFFLSGIRQSVGIGFSMLAFTYLEKKNIKNYIFFSIFVIFGALFHVTTLFFLILLPLSFLKINNLIVVSMVFILFLTFYFSIEIFQLIFLFSNQSSYKPGNYGGGGMFVFYLLLFVFLSVFNNCNILTNKINTLFSKVDNKFFKKHKHFSENKSLNNDITYTKNLYIWNSFLVCFFQSFTLANLNFPRFTFYFLPILYFSIDKTISVQESKTFRILLRVSFLSFFALYLGMCIYQNALNMSPYYFFFI